MKKDPFNWIIPTTLWGMAERGFALLMIGWGVLLLLPGPTFSIAHGWHFMALLWGAQRYGNDVAEVSYGVYLLLLGIHQLVQLWRGSRKWRRVGMLVMSVTFAARAIAFGTANIVFQEVGTGWWDNCIYSLFALLSFFLIGVAWDNRSNHGERK